MLGGSGWARRRGASLTISAAETGGRRRKLLLHRPLNNEALREVNEKADTEGDDDEENKNLKVFIFHLISHPHSAFLRKVIKFLFPDNSPLGLF